MNRLSKQKKQQLVLVVLGTVALLGGLYYGLINWQQGRIQKLTKERDATLAKLTAMRETVKKAGALQTELEARTEQLETAEARMASGDLYAWVINTIRDFKASYDVDIPQYGNILKSETTLLPKFPYKQAMMTVAGSAYYHDLGSFIAEFENQFPYVRIQNLELEPARTTGTPSEKLAFKMDIVTLVKPES